MRVLVHTADGQFHAHRALLMDARASVGVLFHKVGGRGWFGSPCWPVAGSPASKPGGAVDAFNRHGWTNGTA